MPLSLSVRAIEGLSPSAHIELGLTAARLALPFWLRANPKKSYQVPLIEALNAVEAYCISGQLVSGAKEIAVQAYKVVISSDVPSGDIQRSSGFSVAHIAMAPSHLVAGSDRKAQHSAMVAIGYSESIHCWAAKLVELETALKLRRHELREA